MIKLEVEEYCHSCPSFEADVINPIEMVSIGFNKYSYFGDTIIRCTRREACELAYQYGIKQKEEPKGE